MVVLNVLPMIHCLHSNHAPFDTYFISAVGLGPTSNTIQVFGNLGLTLKWLINGLHCTVVVEPFL